MAVTRDVTRDAPRQAAEDYLRAILALGDAAPRVTTSALATRLGVTAPSVTAMVKKLSQARPRLLDYEPHRGVRLTRTGKRIALDVTRRHRLIEAFLVKTLGYGWDEVHAEAHRLEHSVSGTLVERIDRLLGFPAVDPHGRPIPREDGRIAEPLEMPLTAATVGETVRMSSVRSENEAFLQHLSRLGIGLDTPLTLVEVSPLGDVLRIAVGDAQHVIGAAVAREIFVSAEEMQPR